MELDLERWFAAEGWADFVAHVNNLDSDSVAEASEYMRSVGPGMLASLYDSSADSDFKRSHTADWLRSWFRAYGSKEFAVWEANSKAADVTESDVADLVDSWFEAEGVTHFFADTADGSSEMVSLVEDFIREHDGYVMAYVLGGHKFEQRIIDFKESDAGMYLINWFSIIGYPLFAQWLGREGHCDIALAVMAVRASNMPVWIDCVAAQVA